jgi:hypothetical protein
MDDELLHTPPQRLTIDQYNEEAEKAEARIDAGFYTSHEDVINEAELW